ncbi:hypothetical protein FACS1894195_0690 [Bacteroidia bacterium]|nr:hypothetical protein FACS1894195_0690 [Bacteroidia bacterium]
MHCQSSDWYVHGHHEDTAYDNVILSVVLIDDVKVFNTQKDEVECIILTYAKEMYDEFLFMKGTRQQPACLRSLELLNDDWFYMTLQSLAIERLERKVTDIKVIMKQTKNNWGECLYRLICKYWAGNVNEEPFYQLSMHLPYKVILKYIGHPEQIEALLFGVSGLLKEAGEDDYPQCLRKEYAFLKKKHRLSDMKAAQWKFMRIRPNAFPSLRLALLAAFLNKAGNFISYLPEIKTLKDLQSIFEAEASIYWNTHFLFNRPSYQKKKVVGEALGSMIVINAIIPFIFLYGKERNDEALVSKALDWLEEEKAENNFITNIWRGCGFVLDSALQTQAVIQLHREYCEKHRCLQCKIGREVFKSIVRQDSENSAIPK